MLSEYCPRALHCPSSNTLFARRGQSKSQSLKGLGKLILQIFNQRNDFRGLTDEFLYERRLFLCSTTSLCRDGI